MSVAGRIVRMRQHLLTWGDENVRDYPWRRTRDPYSILVAEFMLHRTRADQVRAVYERFVAMYPTLADYAAGDPEVIRRILYPLGLQWRIAGMMQALVLVYEKHGEVPTDDKVLRAIPGIGPYIAAAVRCFVLNEPLALVDTNTVRVTGRVFGLDVRGEARRRKEIMGQIAAACDPDRARDYYFAMIDLAHIICRSGTPACETCPLLSAPCDFGRTRKEVQVIEKCEKTR
jgi:A/G-specific adenine glycosylase